MFSKRASGKQGSGRPVSLRRSLFISFALLALISVGLAALGYMRFGLRPVVENIAASHFNAAAEKVNASLTHLFRPVEKMVGLSLHWAAAPDFFGISPREFNRFFQPILKSNSQISSVVAGATSGRGWMLLELPEGRWRNRFTDIQSRGRRQQFIDWWADGTSSERFEEVDYDARERPWFKAAMRGDADGTIHWTKPYTFFTTRDPGITGSSRVDFSKELSLVIGFDVKLLDISRMTGGLTVGRNGYVMVMTTDGRVLGLPRPVFAGDDDKLRQLSLQPVESLNLVPLNMSVGEWRRTGTVQIVRHTENGHEWLSSFRPFQLGDQTLWVVALAPAADFYPPWAGMATALAVTLAVVLLLALGLAAIYTREFSAPLEALAAASERIAMLDFSTSPPINTRLTELRQLARTQDKMRGMLNEYRDTVNMQSTDLQGQISTLQETEARLEHMSHHDALTNMPNRLLFRDRLAHAVTRAKRSKKLFALLFIDLDNFKLLNDTKGHGVGDQLLIEVARRLMSSVRAEDTVARLGGDEFVVMVEELSTTAHEAAVAAEAVAENIRGAIGKVYSLNGYGHHTTASIGVALSHHDEDAIDELLKHADIAMYRAKQAGRNTVRFFDPSMHAALESRAALEADLRHAVDGNQLVLYYQTQFDGSRHVFGAEALLRWRHPQRGMVPPAEFIPLAEESGLIVPIGAWVLETACAQLKVWESRASTRDLKLAVNVSARQFRQPIFVAQIKSVLEKSGANPRRLTLELTEGLVLENIADSIEKIRKLKTLGIGFSMDDFGTGYSSLSYLSRLPLDQVKIDQSFVRNIGVSAGDTAVVQAIIVMAKSLGLNVIAEGVETQEQFAALVRYGCSGFQGYLISRPLPISEFDLLVEPEPV
jgi:diguanylate cyclase (GGDEF)-like protein